MDYETARMWLDVIAGAAIVAWLVSAWFALSSRRLTREPLVGEVQSLAAPEQLRSAMVAALSARALASPLLGTEILAADAQEIRWRTPRGPLRHDGVLRLTADGRGCRASYGIVVNSPLPTIGMAVAAVALLVVIGLYVLLRGTVLTSEDPSIRTQVIQMVQAVHLLWPPFLFGGITRGVRRRLGDEVARTIRNASFA